MCSARCSAAGPGKASTASGIAELLRPATRSSTASATIVLIFSALGLISVTALNMYGGSLTLISAIDSFSRVKTDDERAAS